jgi:hypothetical protein
MGSWLRISKAAEYADVSTRTIRRWFVEGLKFSKVRGVPYTSQKWIDEFIESHSDDHLNQMVDEVVKEFQA